MSKHHKSYATPTNGRPIGYFYFIWVRVSRRKARDWRDVRTSSPPELWRHDDITKRFIYKLI